MKLNTLMQLTKQPMWAEPDVPGGNPPPPAGDPPPAAPDLSFIPDSFKTDNGFDGAKFREDYDGLTAFKAQQDERLAQVPEAATGYEFQVAEDISFGDLELPDGFTVNALTEDESFKPLFAEFGDFLHKIGAPADASKEAMGMIAKYEATKASQHFTAAKADLATLERGPERVAAIERLVDTRLPAALATALKGATTSADGIRALEHLMSAKSFGAPPPDPSGGKDIDPLKARYPNSA
jgi:hypothetical protein